MEMKVLLTISLLLLFFGVIMVPFTLYYSNSVVYEKSFHLFVGEKSGYTISFGGSPGDLAKIKGYSTYPVLVLQENPPYAGDYLGELKGNFSKTFYVMPFRELLIEGGNYPSNVTAEILVYNTDFSQTGYTISGVLIGLGLVLLAYNRALSKQESVKRGQRKKRK
ncbi:hypothetical protein KN1_12590 [Stygiolobus caldivivus]|uniref:Uncharacterized protein n=2 Tax=Stygiolobus caldivivus TaxID=2824673 RepID=A0A8D5ZJA5_9CREN|nr:hypothetical protein KN1_12590 [Stygiolobus caldivivus]